MPLVLAAGPPLVDLLDDLVSRFVLNCPDEEKASFERLFFQIESAFWFYDDHYREKYPDQYPMLTLKGFAEKLFKHCAVLKPYKDQSAQLFAQFAAYKGQVPTYGAVILDATVSKLLLIRSYNGTTWGFPKGKVNKEEAEHDCAMREVLEEIGLDLHSYLDTSHFLEHSYGRGTSMKLFLVAGVDESVFLETRTKKEIGAIVWHSLSELGTEATKKDKDFWLVQQLIGRIKQWASTRRKELRRGQPAIVRVLAPQMAYPVSYPMAYEPVAEPGASYASGTQDDGFMFGYERERVDVDGVGGVIEGGHYPGGKGAGRKQPSSRAVQLDNRVTFGAEGQSAKGWAADEMFRTNEQQFNLHSTYDFELYTTSLAGKPSNSRDAETTQAQRVRRAAQPPPMQVPTGALHAAVASAAPPAPRAAQQPPAAAAAKGGGSAKARPQTPASRKPPAAAAPNSTFHLNRGLIMRAFDQGLAR
ncbi:hypothetical protein T492DRAFT_1062552 [Pavlovales sp. CCMP2436]|nr:hypothetical protein T492DRAFT_1062552 [Pavlovales sp. CCMP2436]